MQRSEELRDLSSEHHAALVLARKIEQACEQSSPAADLLQEVHERFNKELAPHFAIEERDILPALAATGVDELVEKTLNDHQQMRHLMAHLDQPGNLLAFAQLLKTHIRFEERQLFDSYQRLFN